MKLSNPMALQFVSRKAEEATVHYVQPFDPYASDAERIAAARLRAIEWCKESNPEHGDYFGYHYPPQHYKDYAGPETSHFDAQHLLYIADILETPILRRMSANPRHSYDPRTAEFELSGQPSVSLKELRDAIDSRISELGLSKVKIWEWCNQPSGPGQESWRFDLQTRIKKFNWKATGE